MHAQDGLCASSHYSREGEGRNWNRTKNIYVIITFPATVCYGQLRTSTTFLWEGHDNIVAKGHVEDATNMVPKILSEHIILLSLTITKTVQVIP